MKIAEFPGMPVLCNQLFETAVAARDAQRGDITLVGCPRCGLIWNSAFDPDLMVYGIGYENALHHSPRFREFSDALVRDLVHRRGLAGGTVVEIGCGDGFMLDRFVKNGAGAAVGYDPSMEGRLCSYQDERIEIYATVFDARALRRDVDLVLCRHVLEHLDTPFSFMSDLGTSLGERQIPLYFEVPNAEWMLTAPSPWDVIYEHVTYWTAHSLRDLFRRTGFTQLASSSVYGDQFLSIETPSSEACPSPGPSQEQDVLELAKAFSAIYAREVQDWQSTLKSSGGRVVIWGAGSKGITFANVMGQLGHEITAMIDLNPKKHGRFIPGIGVPVLPPSHLPEIDPTLVLISNGLYRSEIVEQVRVAGVDTRFEIIAA